MHEKCAFPRCEMRFDPELAAQEPSEDGSRFTGWYLPQGVHEPADLETHDHAEVAR